MKKQLQWIAFCVLTVCAAMLCVHALSRTVTVLSENMPIDRHHHIIIDPGHGGVDGGATSCTGRMESAYNLEIALRLRDLLHLLGYETTMIRTSDVSVYTQGTTVAEKKLSDLKERVRIAAHTDGAIVISIHQNHFPDSRYSGAVVLYAPTPGSQELACHLQTTLVSQLNPGSKRQAKAAEGIYLMNRIPCPGILVECGFLSNPQEEAKLRNAAYQKQLCCLMAASLSSVASGWRNEK